MTPEGVDPWLDRARRFVEARGAPLARLRLAVTLGDAPAARLRDAVAWRPESGVGGALAAFATLEGREGLHGPAVERAVAWLEEAQHPDGGWSAARAADEAQRIAVTGLLAGFLEKTSCARAALFGRAGRFLAARWSPERVQGDFGVLAGYAHFFANGSHELADAGLQWCGRELERSVRGGRLRAWQAGRVLALCGAAALPGSRLEAREVALAMLGEQGPDGGWLSPATDAAVRVAVTVDAVAALARLGAAPLAATRSRAQGIG